MTLVAMAVDSTAWDTFVEEQDGSLLQTCLWGRFKGEFGWTEKVVAVGDGERIHAGAMVLFRQLPLGVGSIAYVPRGPVVDWENEEAVKALIKALDEAAQRQGSVLLKFEPDQRDSDQLRARLAGLDFRESVQTVQPPRTIEIDISGETGDVESSDDETLMNMSGSTRRKVRIAYRKGIEIRRGNAEAVESFNRMMQVTGKRNEFGVHSPSYFRRAYDLFAPEHAVLLMASYKEEDIAGLFAFSYGDTAWYFYGASSNKERNRMPTYALQWEAIKWAREQGCTTYDMWGIPDTDEETLEAQFKDRYDGLWGVYGFKRGFGGEVVRSVGAWDRVYRPLMYRIYEIAIRLRHDEA